MTKEDLKKLLEGCAEKDVLEFFDCIDKNSDLVKKFELYSFLERMMFLYRLDDKKKMQDSINKELDAIVDNDLWDGLAKAFKMINKLNDIQEKIEKIRKALFDSKNNTKGEGGDDYITEEDKRKRHAAERDDFEKELEAAADIHLLNLLALMTQEIDKINKYGMKARCLELMEQKNLTAHYEVVKTIFETGIIHGPGFKGKPTSFFEAGDYLTVKNYEQGKKNFLRLKEYYDSYSEVIKTRSRLDETGDFKYPKEIRIQADYSAFTKNDKGQKIELSEIFADDSSVAEIDKQLSNWAKKKYKVFRRQNNIDRDEYQDEGNKLAQELQKRVLKYGVLVVSYYVLLKVTFENDYGEILEYPDKVLIQADYGTAYLWDDGCATLLESYFPHSENAKKIDDEMGEWADWLWDTIKKPGEEFPWEEFNEAGRTLAKMVYNFVKDKNIKVYYAKPYGEEGNNEPVCIIEDKIEERLTEVTIMADYDEHTWTDGVCCSISISDYFPELPEIKVIEQELDDWLNIFLNLEPKSEDFDWESFHEQGRWLAMRLHNILKEYNIPVYYWKPVEDDEGGNDERELIN